MKKTSGDTVKTNAMRQLEVAGISYRTASYEYDESNLSGLHAAEQVGIPAEQVFKTLVTRGDKTGILVFCIPVDMERTAGIDRIYPRWMFSHWHEKEISYLY